MITNKIGRVAVSAIATGAMLLFAMTPAFAATTLEITGNGSGSDNTATVTQNNTSTVSQTNTANITNNVTTNLNTGDNQANRNTNGDVSVTTGTANADVTVSNAANSNTLVSDCTGCTNLGADVLISGNGSGSDNNVNLNQNNRSSVFQTNDARFNNNVNVSAVTGNNRANDNTGGNVSIDTGSAHSTVDVMNTANSNRAVLGAGSGSDNGALSAVISGNGSGSDNRINLRENNSPTLVQTNSARINNNIRLTENTGDNQANRNTNGDVSVTTGDASSDVTIDNMANFNTAALDCCVLGANAKIAGNGSGSDNRITARLNDVLSFFQTNLADLNNRVNDTARTGNNRANDNTGPVIGADDALVSTGGVDKTVDVMNTTNVNRLDQGLGTNLTNLLGNLNIHFDLSGLLSHLF